MPQYSAREIYRFARMAGFSPDQATTMTAIALAESGGRTGAHNTSGENSQGLWQVNMDAHSGWASSLNLWDPVDNAKAAFRISRGGTDISPWTVTHQSRGAPYLRYKAEAQAAAVASGDAAGLGVWTGTPGYGHRVGAGRDDGSDPLPYEAPGTGSGAGPLTADTTTAQPTLVASSPDSDRDGLTDAMETRLGLSSAGVDSDRDNLSDGYELLTLRSDPRSGDTDRDGVGDAMELALGTDPLNPDTDRDGRVDGTPDTPAATLDTDQDGLTDALERLLGSDPNAVDSDRDGFTDGAEYRAAFNPADAASNPLLQPPGAAGSTPGGTPPGTPPLDPLPGTAPPGSTPGTGPTTAPVSDVDRSSWGLDGLDGLDGTS